jgi:hypothetical protein
MTQDEMIEMAKQAGFNIGLDIPSIYAAHERFAKLVAEHERDACAKVAENTKAPFTATAIRARGQALDYEPWTPDDMAYRPDGLPQRTWVGLTDEQKEKFKGDWISTNLHYANISELMDAIEQTLKEKNT